MQKVLKSAEKSKKITKHKLQVGHIASKIAIWSDCKSKRLHVGQIASRSVCKYIFKLINVLDCKHVSWQVCHQLSLFESHHQLGSLEGHHQLGFFEGCHLLA